MIDQLTLETLTPILSKKLGKIVHSTDYQTAQLQGGTLGDVKLLTGLAKTADGSEEPFQLVWKTQRKWERPGDPASWRREYDLYVSDFGKVFSDTFRWPQCYHAEINNTKMGLWMEYINGVSGADLTIEMLEQAALELGRWQGKLCTQPDQLKNFTFLSDTGFFEREHNQWHTQAFTYEYLCSDACRVPDHAKQLFRNNPQWDNGKSVEYNYLRSKDYEAPKHLKQMLIEVDDNREAIFQSMRQLPVLLCHRDFWVENIFYKHGSGTSGAKILLVDWDGAGFGYMGEDIASLIIDDTDTEDLHDYFRRLIPAYYKGLSQYMHIPPIENKVIWEIMILKFGYRIMQEYMFTTAEDVKAESVNRLQKIYEMRDL